MQMTLASPRHFLRRGGMVQDQLEGHLYSSKLVQQVLRDGMRDQLGGSKHCKAQLLVTP